MKSCCGFMILLAGVTFISCNDFNRDIKITGRYHLVAVDTDTDMSLSYKIDSSDSYVGVVDQTVFAIGFNDDYIIVKQHPDNNQKITNCFIVPIYKNYTYSPEVGVLGPLTEEEFTTTAKELNITQLAFTKTIDKLK